MRVGRESLDHWKTILKSLLERGLRRVLIVIHDDFSGLRNVSQSLFPKSDIQLCIVHMQRNAKSHLPKDDYAEFMARIKTIKCSWDMERACSDFDALCDAYAEKAPHFISEIRKKRNHYLHFLKYPSAIRRTFSTTNAVEAVNGQLERMRRNNGGYFHSQHILELKLGMTIDFLEQGKWNKPAASTRAAIHELNTLFEHRFEDELNFAQTQNY